MPRGKKRTGTKKNRLRVPELNNRPMGNPRSVVLPNETDVWLNFVTFNALTAGASTASTRRYRPNCAYDVDPLLGSTNTSGFAELAAIFQYYRVVKYRYEITMVNRETFPLQFVVTNTNTDPGTGSITQYAGNQFCGITMLAGSGGGPCMHTWSGEYRVSDIVGSREVESDDNFASLANTVPVNAVWLSFGVDSGIAGTFVPNGAAGTVKVWMLTRFYERKPLSS